MPLRRASRASNRYRSCSPPVTSAAAVGFFPGAPPPASFLTPFLPSSQHRLWSFRSNTGGVRPREVRSNEGAAFGVSAAARRELAPRRSDPARPPPAMPGSDDGGPGQAPQSAPLAAPVRTGPGDVGSRQALQPEPFFFHIDRRRGSWLRWRACTSSTWISS